MSYRSYGSHVNILQVQAFLVWLILYFDMVYVGYFSEKHSYIWYSTDMVLIVPIFHLLVLGRGISILYDDVCMRDMHRLFEMIN
jgi:hypothetical protein